jgi:ParB family chromosome partitioning protein
MKTLREIPITSIHAGSNDRTVFEPKALQALADNIKLHDLAQPITVNLWAPDPSCVFGGDRLGDGAQYQVIAGERRLRAFQLLGLQTIPAIIVELSPAEASANILSSSTPASN